MGVWGNGVNIDQDYIRRKDGIYVIEDASVDKSFVIKVKKVLNRMDPAICTGGPCEVEPGAEEDAEGLFNFLLDGVGVLLDLESAIMGAFVGDFEKIPGHGRKDTGLAGFRGGPPWGRD